MPPASPYLAKMRALAEAKVSPVVLSVAEPPSESPSSRRAIYSGETLVGHVWRVGDGWNYQLVGGEIIETASEQIAVVSIAADWHQRKK